MLIQGFPTAIYVAHRDLDLVLFLSLIKSRDNEDVLLKISEMLLLMEPLELHDFMRYLVDLWHLTMSYCIRTI